MPQMATPDDTPNAGDESSDAISLSRVAASQLSGEWQFDAIEEVPLVEEGSEQETLVPRSNETPYETKEKTGGASPPFVEQELPPSPEQLIEAMLFVGGHPLTAEVTCAAVRGLTPEQFQTAIDTLNKRYRKQWRPYAIETRGDGFALVIRPAYRNLRERLFGGPRETRLSQPALDVLSVVVYRQPVSKGEVDTIRGTDSGAILRQLVRLGLVAVQHRADAENREVRYGTTSRFLQLFGLTSLDELPRLGESQQV